MSDPPSIHDIFKKALGLPSSERKAYLDEACGDDRKLRDSVERLLVGHSRADTTPISPAQHDSSSAKTVSISGTAGGPSELESTALISRKLLGDRYRVEALLGRGGMGEVWRAFDLKLRVDVALKATHEQVFATGEGHELLRREVRAARDVISPNVCRIFDLETEDGQELVSMEYIDGKTLRSLLDDKSPLELREAGEIASQLLAGLEAIHSAGLVHRDVKPENVMLTRAGRVVVMDFGLARAVTDGQRGISGTPAYMAPEQARGDAVDARADIFSVGVILAEMLLPGQDPEQRRNLWQQLRENPPRVADGPWSPLINKAVAWLPESRYPTARALSRALEEVTLRAEGMEDRTPYPGLSSFSEEDAEYFFGREAEVEALVKKLQRLSMLAIVGPSGFGKSSFLRAGLIPAMAENWDYVLCAPGSEPFNALALALAPHLEGNHELLPQLLQFSDPGMAVDLATKWRGRHERTVLIIDQFEELFTLCHKETQVAFANLLRRLVLDADVQVLLSMRDDFLFHAYELESLRPIFSELTLLESLSGPSLRRALVQPALACGYRFEDEALVDQMVKEVQSERGALPLLAFAAARMWERRNRSTGTLTRQAYEDIGGVSGALAQHAEMTMTALGPEQEPLVREIFRNMVTSQGTRAVRETGELLSVFENRDGAAETLRKLIDARLLTSFDIPGSGSADDGPAQNVEIIHESLLTAWPRLVRWQTQDADGAVLRDQLRQAAQMWEERSRSDDLLWTGTAYREFELWRDQYPGGLTDSEEHFATAMKRRIKVQTRIRRWATTTTIVVLLAVIGVVSGLWQKSSLDARRARARTVLSHAEDMVDRNASMAFAYTLASLELADDEDARRLALRVLQTGPVCVRPPGSSVMPGLPADAIVDFSPDGRQLAVGGFHGDVNVWSDDGSLTSKLPSLNCLMAWVDYGRESNAILTYAWAGGNKEDGHFGVRVWDMPRATLIRSLSFPVRTTAYLAPDASSVVTSTVEAGGARWRRWPLPDGPPEELGTGPFGNLKVDHSVQRIVYGRGPDVFVERLDQLEEERRQRIGRHSEPVTAVRFDVSGERVASADESGQVKVWSLNADLDVLEFQAPTSEKIGFLKFSPDGAWLAAAVPGIAAPDGLVWLWDLSGPPDAKPLELQIRNETPGGVINMSFHPTQPWIVSSGLIGPALWPLSREYCKVFRQAPWPLSNIVVDPNGSWALGCGQSPLAAWVISPDADLPSIPETEIGALELAIDPLGEFVLCGTFKGASVIDLEAGTVAALEGFEGMIWAVAVSPSGRRYAVGGGQNVPSEKLVRVWERETGAVTVLDVGSEYGLVSNLQFLSDDQLLEVRDAGIWVWDLRNQTHRRISEDRKWRVAPSPDSREFVSIAITGDHFQYGPLSLHDVETGSVRDITAFGDEVSAIVYAPDGRIVAGTTDGAILVGYPDEEPHLLMGHRSTVGDIQILPDGRIVSVSDDKTVRVWPMPDLSRRPLHTLPYEELMKTLRGVTNLRMVEDDSLQTGYRMTIAEFPGWESLPVW